jgi:hypothetical protein
MMDDTIILVLIVLGVLAVVTAVSYVVIKRTVGGPLEADAAKQQAINQGIEAEATVIDVWETGFIWNHKPQLSLRLKVILPNPYKN